MGGTLLEPVAAGQTRFRLHGLSADPRGVAVGRETLLVFETLDRLVAFLGAYSREANLDEVLSRASVERGARVGGGRVLMLRTKAGDAYQLDRLARISAAARGRVYVGAGETFVRCRERKAPFGYDISAREGAWSERESGAIAIVDPDRVGFVRAGEPLDPVALIRTLSLRAIPIPGGSVAADPDHAGLRDMALVLVAPGLADRVLAYLWRRERPMAGVRIALGDDRDPCLLLRLRNPDFETLDVLREIPGVELLAPVSPRAAVEVGYEHPIHLAAADDCLPPGEMCLFRGGVGRVECLEGAPRFTDGRYLVESTFEGGIREIESVRGFEARSLKVDLRLRRVDRAREVRGVLVPWEELELLRKLIYAIPPGALAAGALAPLEDGLLILAARPGVPAHFSGVDLGAVIPVGARFVDAAGGVLVPDGFELWPRVQASLARELMGLGAEDVAVFLREDALPVRIASEHLVALDAATVTAMAPIDASLRETPAALGEGTLENDRLGRFALWGFRRQVRAAGSGE